jgi:putative ABC transport system permease protein
VTYGQLALRSVRRNPLRLLLTLLAGAVGVTAFIFLHTVIDLFYTGARVSQVDRLIVRSKIAFTQPLPLSYFRRISSIPGVSAVTYQGWFGGRINDSQKDFFANFYVDPNTYFGVYDELEVPPAELAAFKADPCGAVAGRDLVDRFGWKVGDRIVLKGAVYPGDYEVTVRGIATSKREDLPTNVLYFGYRCVNERQPEAQRNMAGLYGVRVEDPARSAQVAATIDGMFASSAYPTRAESERAFRLGFVAMSSAIMAAIQVISYVILLIILLVIGNTLAMGVRERTIELATLRAIGFRRPRVVLLVLLESAIIGAGSSALGLLASPVLIHGFASLVKAVFGGRLPEHIVQTGTLVTATVASLAVALLAGAIPAMLAVRPSVAEGLRRVA